MTILINEIWKPIQGYEGLYEVSSKGLIRRLLRGGGFRYLSQNNKDVSEMYNIATSTVSTIKNNKNYRKCEREDFK